MTNADKIKRHISSTGMALASDRTRWVRVAPTIGGEADHRFEQNSDVCLVARSLGAAGAFSEWLASLGVAVSATKDLGAAIANLRHSYRSWAAAVIYVDGFGGPIECFDQLRLLREECPGLPVIVVSADFAASDFSAERLPLCDVCLRFPVDPAEYTAAWVTAIDNSRKWRQFKVDMRKLALNAHRDVARATDDDGAPGGLADMPIVAGPETCQPKTLGR